MDEKVICVTSSKWVLTVFATEAHSSKDSCEIPRDAKRIDHINCQQASRDAKVLEDGSYHVGMLHARFKVELTLMVAKDGYETFVKHSGDHLSLN